MIGKIEFPEGVTFDVRYITATDMLSPDFDLLKTLRGISARAQSVFKFGFDTSNVTNMSYAFDGCSNLKNIFGNPNTSNVTNMSYAFYYCSTLTSLPHINTSNVTDMSNMCNNCLSLEEIPYMDTSNVTNMYYAFNYCQKITSFPQLDMSKVTNVGNMFSYCSKLETLPDFNTIKLQTFGSYGSASWLYNASNIKKMGVIDCDSVTSINYVFGDYSRTLLTEFGGCRNLGKYSSLSGTNGTSFMTYAPNLTYESVMNVINLLYDRAANGLSTLTLKLHTNHMAMLSEDDIAVATNKGWTLTA